MYKTTKKDYQEFRKESIYWLEYFGMTDWQVHFDHEKMDDCRASCYYDISGRVCTISLNTHWAASHKPKNMKRLAFHEVCELLLGELDYHASSIYNHGTIQEIKHTAIRRLENSIFKEHRC